MVIKIEISGIRCNGCKALIEDILEDLEIKILSFDINLENSLAKLEIETNIEVKKIVSEIESEGDYKVKVIE